MRCELLIPELESCAVVLEAVWVVFRLEEAISYVSKYWSRAHRLEIPKARRVEEGLTLTSLGAWLLRNRGDRAQAARAM